MMRMLRSTAAPRPRAWWILLPGSMVIAAVIACGSGDLPLDEVDPGSVPANPTYDQVYAIIDRACVPCHTDGEEDGEEDDAPVKGDADARFVEGAFDLSTCTAVVARREDSWETIVNNTMPPGAWPRLTSAERLTIQRWMDNGAPAPCNPVPVAARRNGGAR